MLLFEVNELGLTTRLSDLLYHSFKHTISFLISFPLMRGEGWDGGGHRGSFPPPLSSPSVGGGSYFFNSIGVKVYLFFGCYKLSKDYHSLVENDLLR